MSEEINEEQPEAVEEKSLEDEIAALEEVASTLEDETEVKSEDGEESESEEKAEGETEEKARQHPVATGYPHDRVEMQPGPPEFDEEEDEKNWEGPKKRRVVVVEMDPDDITDDMKAYVVDVPDDDEEEDEVEELALHEHTPAQRARIRQGLPPGPPDDDEEEEEMALHPRARMPLPDDDEDVPLAPPPPAAAAPAPPAPPAPPPGPPARPPVSRAPNPRLARLLEQANGPTPASVPQAPVPDEDDEEMPPRRFRQASYVGRKDGDAPESYLDTLDPVALTARLKRLGLGRSEIKTLGDADFLCAIERKVLNGDVCNFCRGGCASEKGLPGLLEIEVQAETDFKGEVVDSGYAPKDDIFVVDMKTNEGFIETYYSGAGSALGWIALSDDIEEKSAASDGTHIVSFEEAEQIALKNVKGKSLGVDVDIFQGEDAYVVEIDGLDGKSYDAYVGVDGGFLGSDMVILSDDEEEEIRGLIVEKEALEAEVQLKRTYSPSRAAELAEEGLALKGGQFPIVSPTDLENAILAASRVKTHEVREHIIKRADEMQKSEMIPEEWRDTKSAEEAEFAASLMELQMLEAELPNESESDA